MKKQWNMSLRRRRQAVVRPMDLAFTGVNSKVAQTDRSLQESTTGDKAGPGFTGLMNPVL